MSYNPFSLQGKKIVVTGASSGIGRAIAVECSRMGAIMVITGRNEERLEETLSLLGGKGHVAIQADLSDEVQLECLVGQIDQVDGVVNNAGITITVPTQFITRDKLNEVLSVNTIAPILFTQKLLKNKQIIRGGSIVFTNSISGTTCVWVGNVLYSVSKAAISGFVRNAALDLSSKGIRVNEVCPGMVHTRILSAGVISEEQLEEERIRYPMKRFGTPEEVAYAIIYFLSDASSFTTGSRLVVDGGFTLL